MSVISTKTIFAIKGDSLEDFSAFSIPVTANAMTEAHIVDEELQGKAIKCLDFSTTGYLAFNLDTSFFQNPFTIEWWEKDYKTTGATLSAVFTNVATKYSLGLANNNTVDLRNITNLSSNGSANFALNLKYGDAIANEWVHRAFVYTGTDYRFYQNGILYTTVNNASTLYSANTAFQMGRWRTSGGALCKKIYNFRVESRQLYYEDFTPNADPITKKLFHINKYKGIYEYNLAYDFKNADSVSVTVNDAPLGTFDNQTPIVVDTNSYEPGEYVIKFTITAGTNTFHYTENISINSQTHLQEYASYVDITNKIKALTVSHSNMVDILQHQLARLGVVVNENKLSKLISRLEEVKGLEFKDHEGSPVFLEYPKPVIDLDLASFTTGNKELLFKNSQYKGKIVGDTYSKTGTSLDNTGTSYVDINYAPKLEGAIVLNFSATEASSSMYGRIFRTSSDGVSLYYKQASGIYEIKFYGVAGGYIQNLAPAEIENKRLIITWSAKNKVAKLYIDGALRTSLTLDPSLMQKNYALYLGDNQQNDSGRAPYTIPSSITEFKAFDCYLDENAILEV